MLHQMLSRHTRVHHSRCICICSKTTLVSRPCRTGVQSASRCSSGSSRSSCVRAASSQHPHEQWQDASPAALASLQEQISADSCSQQQQHTPTLPAADAAAAAAAAVQQAPTPHRQQPSSNPDRATMWSAAVELLRQGLVLAAVSGLVLSMCLSAPAASAHLLQQQHSHASTHQHTLVIWHAAPSAYALLLQQQHPQAVPAEQQPHQQHQWHFELPGSSDSSSSTGSSWSPQQRQRQQQQQQAGAVQFELGSPMEDSLLEGMRQLEAGVDRAWGALSTGLHSIDAAEASSERAAMDAQAQALINEVWEVVDTNYLDARRSGFDHDKWARLRDEALARRYYDTGSIHRAVRDMLAQGVADPYCRFIEPREFAAMKKYDVTGVGLNLGTAEEFVKKTGRPLPRPVSAESSLSGGVWVVGLSKDSEADRAGIQQGDELLQVSGLPLSGVTPFQAATLIAGPDDSASTSSVGLTVKKADGAVVEVVVTRPARVLASPVSSSLQQRYGSSGGAVGVIRLTSFNARALRDVSAALEGLTRQGATELVLDLRDNRGGLVSEGLEVARLFLSDSVPIVLTQSKAMAADPPRALSRPTTRLPLTVLVNEHTASASEILAGAIKDNCRGVLVGKRTYGKGLIQSVYELSDSSGLIITVGKYLTPRGTDIDRFGIAPDFTTLPDSTAAAAALNACRLEADAAAGSGEQQQQQLQPQVVGASASVSGVA